MKTALRGWTILDNITMTGPLVLQNAGVLEESLLASIQLMRLLSSLRCSDHTSQEGVTAKPLLEEIE